MDRIAFEIFIPDGKKIRWTPNIVFLLFWFIPLCLQGVFQTFISGVGWLQHSLVFYDIFGVITAFCCFVASNFLRETLNGVIKGRIEFGKDFIRVNDTRFQLSDVYGINFALSDYYGRTPTVGGTLNPRISQGIKNYVTFEDRGNQTHLINFRLPGKHSYLSLSDIINEAVKTDKMDIYRAEYLIGKENIVQ